MTNNYFISGNILLPDKRQDMSRWSVIACDQFTSEPEYWERVEKAVGSSPSTLRLMLPEAYLKTTGIDTYIGNINKTMSAYLLQGLFEELKSSYIYVERTLSGGGQRCGLLGLLDLEAYDYNKDSVSLIRATEGMVPDRLPPRVRVRKDAPLEVPHIIVFIDDADRSVIEPLSADTGSLKRLYDFKLMEGGGRVRGYQVDGEAADKVCASLNKLSSPGVIEKKYGKNISPVIYAVGDGNHSLASAKMCWEMIRDTLSQEERITHPARWTLVEIVNVHEESIIFEPINRVIFNTESGGFLKEAEEFFSRYGNGGHELTCISSGGSVKCYTDGLTIGQSISACEEFIEGYAAKHGGKIDYIHGDETTAQLGSRKGCAGVIMPRMKKSELFPSIIKSGAFPKKSFSIGPAKDKRYYLECRKISL
jgi:hypothetical protein